MNMISPAQLRMIYGLSRRCDMDEETLHAMVLAQTGVASLKQLTSHQAAQIIDQLRTRRASPVREDIPGRASDGQRRMILQRDQGAGMDGRKAEGVPRQTLSCVRRGFPPLRQVRGSDRGA